MLDLTLTLHHYYMQTCYPRIQSPEYTILVWSLSSYIDLSHYSLLAINVLRFDYYYHIEKQELWCKQVFIECFTTKSKRHQQDEDT